MPALIRTMFVSPTVLIVSSRSACAGMPSFTLADVFREATRTGLTDLARQRVEAISFFLVILLACTWIVQWIWNGLRKDFPVLPRLSYPRALGVIVLWGLLFVLVLTMISGARELMTPGAWEKKGLTYRLTPLPPAEVEITARVKAIHRLGDRLAAYSKKHGGRFPTTAQVQEIAEQFWQVPTPPGGRYLYVGGPSGDKESSDWPLPPLAYEPESVGPDRLVLSADGNIQWMPASEIERALSSREP